MKRLFICFLAASILFAGCRTTMPIREDDVSVNVQLHQSFTNTLTCKHGCSVHQHGHYYHNQPVVTFGFWGGYHDGDGDAFLVFLMLLFTAGWYFGSTRMYVAPEGFETEYTQQLYWGDNRVFLPKETEEDGAIMILESFGNNRRKWRYPLKPEKHKALILKEGVIQEKIFKPRKLKKSVRPLREMKGTEEDLKNLGIITE